MNATLSIVREALGSVTGIEPADVRADHTLAGDFCLDELDLIELVMRLEADMQREISDDVAARWQTVQDVADAVAAMRS